MPEKCIALQADNVIMTNLELQRSVVAVSMGDGVDIHHVAAGGLTKAQ